LFGNVVVVLTTMLGLVLPYLLKLVVDAMLQKKPLVYLLWLAAVGVGVFVVQFILGVARRYLIARNAESAHKHLRERLLDASLTAGLLSLKKQPPGHVATLVELDSRAILSFPEAVLPSALSLATTLLGTAAVLVWLSPQLFFLILLPAPIVLLIGRAFHKSIAKRSKELQNARAGIFAVLFEAFASIESIKIYGGEDAFSERVRERGERVYENADALIGQRAWLFPTLNLVLSSLMLSALVAGGYMVSQDMTSTSIVVAVYLYLSRMLAPVRGATELLYGWHRYHASEQRIQDFLGSIEPLPLLPSPKPLPPGPNALLLEDVSFKYADGAPVLSGLNLEVGVGDWVAILGPSGAGKSTLGKLVPRLFDPDAGRLLLGEIPLTELDLDALRGEIGYVGQEVLLFEGTLRENLLFGVREEVDEDFLAWVIDIARVRPIVDEREEGLESMLGQGGGDLSGGQKKRVALARALLRRPEVIVIDQMASDLEASLNREIFTRLSEEFEGAILYLGHRVPDGFTPDAVYWLEAGQLAPREYLA